ncbi:MULTISPECIES: DUF2971 domain-containing protein [unclassified Pseudomonas]|uniref:DUF2971 domain-containing protein n=2 Tax=Pseudomonas TaxID=286 RepID=UPI00215D1414|nr:MULTISPECIES: DUF2971 domain-containing protein [unclassified Pseudomonas]MCR8930408.1 DUF2971 domain-containing protein [Pseudomonas sp. S11A4]MCR8974010.1 DUF2971 domain-containing protein [Pseudomonas sp. S11P7]
MTSTEDGPKRLYRILDFTRVVQIFERGELYFANPSKWDDPYERRISHSRSHALFAQCWCQLGISDAMWRIYSQNGMGVRISTTDKKLNAAVKTFVRDKGYRFRLGEVDYKSQADLNFEARKIAAELRENFKIKRAVDILYMKREAFRHESEWRATIFCPDEKRVNAKDGIAVKIDPHKLIDRILLDPRAPGELVDAFKFYFEKKLGFKGTVIRSVLYKSPKPLEVDDEFITVEDL